MSANPYAQMSQAELIAEITALKKRKKYGLVWAPKTEAIVEQCKTQLPVLAEVAGREVNADASGGAADQPVHILIEGDNYHSLSVLNYTHGGKVEVIYIDPPYNTGAKDWKYNNDYVDKEDGYRHSKWLSMMEKRLRLARNLLSPTGFICCAIDHNELFTLGSLMDEIFGEDNRLGVVTVVHSPRGKADAQFFSITNEYVLVYARKKEQAKLLQFQLSDEELLLKYNKEDEISRYVERPFVRTSSNSFRKDRPNMYYPIYVNPHDKTLNLTESDGDIKLLPLDANNEERVWCWGKESFIEKKETELVVKESRKQFRICFKSRASEISNGATARTVWKEPKYDAVSHGTNLLKKIIGQGKFAYPKSLYAVLDILKITSNPDSIILDFFAGSGTTGHAVLELNKQDGGRRQFILCTNNENNIAEQVTHVRMEKVMQGYYKNGAGEAVAGLGGRLKYYQTDFVKSGEDDVAKYALSEKATEMLCVKENTFDAVKITQKYKIYRNHDRHTAIILHEAAADNCKKVLAKLPGNCTVYLFSLGSTVDTELFDDMPNVTVSAIPEAILRIYRRLFK